MFRKMLLPGLLILLSFSVLSGGLKLKKPVKRPVPATAEQKAVRREGIQLHDQGKYAEAVEKFQSILRENPDETLTMYELAYTYCSMQKYEEAVRLANEVCAYRSSEYGSACLIIGNCLDEQGRGKEAIKIYQQGIKDDPGNHLLYYNLALALLRRGQPGPARENLQLAALKNPGHPGSQLLLAQVFRQDGLRVPALLAYCRFLILEPASPRTGGALQAVQEIINSFVQVNEPKDGKGNYTINLSMPGKKDRDGTVSLDLMASFSITAMLMQEENKTEGFNRLGDLFKCIFSSCMAGGEEKASFISRYYLPYFAELSKQDFTETFTAFVLQNTGQEDAARWREANPGKLEAFTRWTGEYRWPAGVQ